MGTHKEEIDVPENWTVDRAEDPCPCAHCRDEGLRSFRVFLKPVPPPEPAMENCRYCGAKWKITEEDVLVGGPRFYLSANHPESCLFNYTKPSFDTRLAAIQAANRRAP